MAKKPVTDATFDENTVAIWIPNFGPKRTIKVTSVQYNVLENQICMMRCTSISYNCLVIACAISL